MNKGQDMVLSSVSLLCIVFVFFIVGGGGGGVKVTPLRLNDKKNSLKKTAKLKY